MTAKPTPGFSTHGHGPSDATVGLLLVSLEAAVPLWIDRLSKQSWAHVMERSRACGDVVAEKGDIIQFRSKKKGESAAAFNALAEGIACLAFARGGVRFAGLHFEAKHPELSYGEDGA